MILSVESLHAVAHLRPPGYVADVLSRGTLRDGLLELSESAYQELCAKYQPRLPTLAEMASHFTRSMGAWARAGFALVTDRTFIDRVSTCLECPNVTRTAGVLRCKLCGCCTAMKAHLATAKCPENRW